MSDFDFKITGLEDMIKDFTEVTQTFPDESEKRLKNIARRFVKATISKVPNYKSINKKWKTELNKQKFGILAEVCVYNKSLLHHLVENGHEKWINGRNTGGFVPGKHYTERTRKEYEEILPKELEQFCDEMLERRNL